ncbi:hypothetical protein F5888DRAFT_1635180 [Russula emetica]|nr:hypothetical protein F5888DRAFT_1635180 [Russula emetica]
MSGIIVKVMVDVLLILALVTMEIKQGKIKRFLKKLIGRSDIEDALRRFEKLTQEESRMVGVQGLKAIHGVGNDVRDEVRVAIKRVDAVLDGGENMRVELQQMARGVPRSGLLKAASSGVGKVWFLTLYPRSAIIQDINGISNTGTGHLAFFFFDFEDSRKQDARALLSSIIVQLSNRSVGFFDVLHGFYSARRDERREADKELVINTLSEKADGMFRWVFCQLETPRPCLPSSVRGILAELPQSLDATKFPSQIHAHRLLQCLTAAVRPLAVEELAEVLAIDFDVAGGIPKLNRDFRWADQEQAVLSACSSLIVIVSDENSRRVQFSHFSVKEFLSSDRLATSEMAALRFTISTTNDSMDEKAIEGYPLAKYAGKILVKLRQS